MLFILKQLDVQNLTISSEAKQLPLIIKELNAQLQDGWQFCR